MLISLLFICTSNLNSQSQQKDKDLLISTNCLEENLTDSLLVILHYGMKTDFKKEHIPGARFISIWDILEKNDRGLRHELPDEKQLIQVLRSWGINNNSNIVICYQDGNAIPMAARLFYTLDFAGLGEQVSILNGGLKAWKQEERALTDEIASFQEGNVDIRIVDEVRITKDEVLANLDNESVMVIDARPPEKYYGTEEDQSLDRSGHIPGAVNIPYYETTRDDSTHLFKDEEELRILFEEYHIQEGSSVITYCGTGIWASPLYFAARILGYKVQLYDGSFQEWGNDESLPVQ
jgi:thiosulfate/3-mercaptopyruvate sulfurtransferase